MSKTAEKFYFAYGSNINLDQMRFRCPNALVIDTVTLPDYELLFRGDSCNGLATVEPKPGGLVHGLLWKLTPRCEYALDVYEGFPTLYDKRDVTVRDSQGRDFTVMAYVMASEMRLRPALPSRFYYQGIMDGYLRTGLPAGALEAALEHTRRELVAPPLLNQTRMNLGGTRLCFAFGSNLNHDQMAERCPDAEPVGIAVLNNYALTFRGRDSDGSGVATIVPRRGGKVRGLLWALTARCEASLDKYEGCPAVYEKRDVKVRDEQGRPVTAMAYVMTRERLRPPAMPSREYYNRIRDGYLQNGFPERDLIRAIHNLRVEMGPPDSGTPERGRRRDPEKKNKKRDER